MKIPFMNLYQGFEPYKKEILDKIESLINRTQFIGGEEVRYFEEEFSQYCKVPYTVGCGNGTDALIAALHSLNLNKEDTVLVPANTFIATSEAVSLMGANVDFVDVEDKYWTMDPLLVEKYIKDNPDKNVAAVIPVHLYGQMAAMDDLLDLSKKYGFSIIEDAAQAHGASYKGKGPGEWGKAATFSFYPGKNLGAFGDAGAIITKLKEIQEDTKSFINHGRKPQEKYQHSSEGVNFRLDSIQAAVLRIKLRHLRESTSKRQGAASTYDDLLKGVESITLPVRRLENDHVYYVYVIHTDKRDKLKSYLDSKGISTVIHYPIPLHLQPAYASKGYSQGDFPMAEKNTFNCLSLPLWAEISREQQQYVAAEIKGFFSTL